ncbi:MAG: sulfatase-like hydrolase/transferase [Coriobacteriales bacterium]|nr:sulfatase-like hydrolase/transferase [Coriobacteriales bacterium]
MTRRIALAELGAVWLALVAKALLMRWLVFGEIGLLAGLAFEGAVLLAILVIVDLLFPDHRFWALWTTDAILSAGMLATVLYAGYYGQIATVGLLQLAGQVPAVRDSLRGLVSPIQLLFAVDLVAMLAYRWWLWSKSATSPGAAAAETRPDSSAALGADAASSGHGRDLVRQYSAVYLSALPAIVLAAILVVGVVRLPQPVDGLAASKRSGVFAYQVANLFPRRGAVSANVDLSDPVSVQAEIERLRGGTRGKRLADFEPGAFGGKNVIVIQVEALQTAALDLKVQGKEVTPYLNRLADKSWYFPNTFTQVGGGNTADAEFMLNTSLYPPLNAAASQRWPDRELPSFMRLLKQSGYTTMTFHANTAHFWNRVELYGALGFDKFYDSEFFGGKDVLGMGASDEVLYAKVLPELQKLDDAGTPFCAQLITLSSHRPFDGVPKDRLPLQITGQWQDTFTADYLSSQSYADRALGEFLAELERTGLAEDSIVVVYGDHFGLVADEPDPRDAEAQRDFFGHEMTEADLLSVPLIIRMPGQETGTEVRDPVGQIDIMPTLADALGVDLARSPHFGRSAFVRSPVLMPAARIVATGSFIDETSLFVPGVGFDDGHAYSANTKMPSEARDAQRDELERVRKLMTLAERYTDALPQRADYVPDDKAVVPQEAR